MLMTALYLAPENPLTKNYNSYTSGYMSFLFPQNWELFARNLQPNWSAIHYQCQDSVNWLSFSSGLLNEHIGNRFQGSGKKYYYYNYLANEFVNEYRQALALEKSPDELKRTSINLSMIFSLISSRCPKGFNARLVLLALPKYSERFDKELKYDAYILHEYSRVKVQ